MRSLFSPGRGVNSCAKYLWLTPKARLIAWRLAALGVALLAGCAGHDDDPGSNTASGEPELIGGHPAGPDDFRSTVAIDGTCTAAKVGPRLFLTAAHCVAVPRPTRAMPAPDDFPPNAGVYDDYLPGKPLLIDWGLQAADGLRAEFTIVKTSIHPSWWMCPLCVDPILDPGGAADIAVVEIQEDTPQIPQAQVELGTITMDTQVVKVGWGCEERTNVDPDTVELGRYKLANATIISVSEIRKYDSRITDEQVDEVDGTYLVTAGHDQAKNNASLCLGDSGGPLYLLDTGKVRERRVVGVNSDYTFRPPEDESDLGGVSWTDWHTRTSLGSRHAVGQWLKDLKVNTVGGH